MPKVSPELAQQIKEAKRSGLSNRDIAAKFSVDRTTVARHAKDKPQHVMTVELPTIDLTAKADALFPDATGPAPLASTEPDKVLTTFMKSLDLDAPQKPKLQPVPKPPSTPKRNPQEMIQRILLNAETFPELFPSPPSLDSLSKKSYADLEALLSNMEHTRTIASVSAQMKNVFFVTSRATEVLGSAFLKLKTSGMTEALQQQQQELNLIFKEIAIKHADKFQQSTEPEVRLLLLFGMTVLQTDATNRLRDRMSAPKDVEQEYKDL